MCRAGLIGKQAGQDALTTGLGTSALDDLRSLEFILLKRFHIKTDSTILKANRKTYWKALHY